MKGLKKILIGLGIMGVLARPIHLPSQEIPYYFNIPKKFENYKEKYKFPPKTIKWKGTLFRFENYDIDGDGITDVQEMYLLVGYKDNKLVFTEYPLFYCFDVDGSIYFEPEEIFSDEKMDGLNGNEKCLKKRTNI